MKKLGLLLILAGTLLGCDNDTDYLITIKTNHGEMKAILFDDTPMHKENFIKLAREGEYDSTIFHRVIEEFMIQGGDLTQKANPSEAGDHKIPAEFVRKRFHRKGAIAAARQPDQVNPERESSGSQFYIVQGKKWEEGELLIDQEKLNNHVGTLLRMPGYDSLRDELVAAYQAGDYQRYQKMMYELIPDIEQKLGQDVKKEMSRDRIDIYTAEGGYPFLDDEYTVFGQVIDGLDVIDKIAGQKTVQNRPVETVYMEVIVEEVPKRKISKEYGVSYGPEQ